jgi:predicted ATPase/transcriptional regulator with XRE-family HTH domain/DNA-binding CsgD family transcriptional regulator
MLAAPPGDGERGDKTMALTDGPGPGLFGVLLQRYRVAAGLSQEALAERAGLSRRGISDLERGARHLPHPATVRRLAEALNLDDAARAAWLVKPRELAVSDPSVSLEAPTSDRRTANLPADTTSFVGRTNELPSARTSFVGRQQLLADLRRRLASPAARAGLLTLTGPGGTGKTRLGLEAADAMRDHYADGVCFVELAPISDPRLVASTIAQALGVPDSGLPPLERLKRYLRDRHLLLILDNFEQLLGAAIEVGELVDVCTQLQVMVTSRAPLRLLAEQELAIPPLALPDAGSRAIVALEQCESVRLFVDRARAVKADFELTETNASAVVDICRRLDGLPLAIELAAARTRLLDPPAMLARLERRLPLLTGGARDAPRRQQTLRNAIAWSYDLLETKEQLVFRLLSVFVGGTSLDAARAVCAPVLADDAGEMIDLVDSLVAKNLLRTVAAPAGEVRVDMFETIREFGLEQLASSGELEPARRRHAAYFLALAHAAEPGLAGSAARAWLDRLDIEHDNLRAALEWCLSESAPGGEMAQEMAGVLTRFWWLAGNFGEGRRWLARALAATPAASQARVRALHGAGWLAHFQRDAASARTLLEESLALAEQRQDRWWQAWVLHALGRVAYFEYDAVAARDFGERSLSIAEQLGDSWLIAWAVHLLGLAAYIADDYPMAQAYYDRSLAIRRELGHLDGIVILLYLKGIVSERSGDVRAALALYREALQVGRELNSAWLLSSVLAHFVSVAAQHNPERAARIVGAVTLMSESAHTVPIPITEVLFNNGVQEARQKLGESAFTAAWAEGRVMSLDAVVTEALAVELGPPAHYPAGLTAAEIKVLRRLASGCTTRQIADDLVVAVTTVDRHLTHIYQKIGRRGRAAATAFAVEHGLLH